KYSGYDLLAGIGSIAELNIEHESFSSLQKFYEEERDWLFGFFTYDLKNEINKLASSNFDGLNFPSIHFFRPRYVIALQGNNCEIHFDSKHDAENTIDKLFDEIISAKNHDDNVSDGQIEIKQRISRNEYIEDVKKILAHIQRGDVYELNYCQEFYSEDVVINPVQAYLQLNEFSPMPF